jgi:hypothetical protein
MTRQRERGLGTAFGVGRFDKTGRRGGAWYRPLNLRLWSNCRPYAPWWATRWWLSVPEVVAFPSVGMRRDSIRGVEAVIDKDLTAALLARELGADALLLLTDVDAVEVDFGTDHARPIRHTNPIALRAPSRFQLVRWAPRLMQPVGSLKPREQSDDRSPGRRLAALGRNQGNGHRSVLTSRSRIREGWCPIVTSEQSESGGSKNDERKESIHRIVVGSDGSAQEESSTRRIVVGIDGSAPSVVALQWAANQASLTGAVLEVVMTWEWPISYGGGIYIPPEYDPGADATRFSTKLSSKSEGTTQM